MKMEAEETMLSEFADNVKANFEQLQELFKAYDLAKLGYDMQAKQEKDGNNKVLAQTPFYAKRDCKRAGIKAGDRVTDVTFIFLLSDDDFKAFLNLTLPILVADGVTDEKGYYITDWLSIKGDARRKLVAFIIEELLPWDMRLQFKPLESNIVQTDKLLAIIRSMVTKTA